MKIGIMTNEAFENRQKNSVGSSRIRCNWVVNNWPEAELFKIGVKYDVVIYQKAYFIKHAEVFDGIKILDMCDPDWLDQKPVVEMINLCDVVTTSSEKLAEYIKTITDKPVSCVPDRVDMQFFQDKKEHSGHAKDVVWFGYSGNHKMIDSVLMTLKRLSLSLTVISEAPYYPSSKSEGIEDDWIKRNLKNIKYDHEFINKDIIDSGDIVINPKSETGKFKFKSDNKTLISWALGMPVAETSIDLEKFMNEEDRKKEAESRLVEVKEKWTSDKSVKEFKDIIKSIDERKRSAKINS